MPDLDLPALIERAARAQLAVCDTEPDGWAAISPKAREGWLRETAAALPVTTAAILAPLRELHTPRETRERLPNGVSIRWHACSCGFRTHSACPTVQALDAIEAAVKGGE